MSAKVTRLSDHRPNDFDAFSTGALLDAIIQLTHMVRSTDDERLKATYRARRDVARREVLKRCER
jgi:hypothetical protein